jgi:ketosteroid isomerase-like protein
MAAGCNRNATGSADGSAMARKHPKSSVDATDLDLARAAFVEAVRSRDATAIAGLYGDGARLLAPESEVLRGRGDVAAFWGAGVASGIADVELEPEDVERLPDVAWEVGRYALRLEPEGGDAIVDRGRYLLVYRFDAGGWRRAAEMFAPDALSPALGRPA